MLIIISILQLLIAETCSIVLIISMEFGFVNMLFTVFRNIFQTVVMRQLKARTIFVRVAALNSAWLLGRIHPPGEAKDG